MAKTRKAAKARKGKAKTARKAARKTAKRAAAKKQARKAARKPARRRPRKAKPESVAVRLEHAMAAVLDTLTDAERLHTRIAGKGVQELE